MSDESTSEHLRKLEIHTTATEEEIRKSWEASFTDPKEHNPNNFCYLVYGFVGKGERTLQKLDRLDMHAKDKPQPYWDEEINLFENPRRISEKKIVATSVINQNHTQTFSSAGLILKVPFENIVGFSPVDVGSSGSPERVMSKLRGKISTIEELLQQTPRYSHNEVVLLGKTAYGEVEVIGSWRKVTQKGKPLNPDMTARAVALGIRLGLPRISIVEK